MAAMSTTRRGNTKEQRKSSVPPFPLEIWALVLGHLVNKSDFPEVWDKCRRVSRSFRRAAELAFQSEALRHAEVNLSLQGCVGRNYKEVVQLQFKGVSEDGNRVHYGKPGDGQIFVPTCFDSAWRPGLIHFDRDRGNLPLLIEWSGKIYISVCRGPATYYEWSEHYKQQQRHLWLKANTKRTMDMIVHHSEHEVSFLWQPMLKILLGHALKSTAAKDTHKKDNGLELTDPVRMFGRLSLDATRRVVSAG